MKLINKNRSAGNLIKKKQGSSETTRDISKKHALLKKKFIYSKKKGIDENIKNINLDKNKLIQNSISNSISNSNNNKNFYYWLGGLIDGDGSLLLNKKGYVNMEITLDEKDIQTLAYIKKNLGFGNITKRIGVKAVRIRSAAKQKNHIITLLENLEGKLLTEEKQKQWEICVNAYNIEKKEKEKKIRINDIITKTPWFSGFIDAEGHLNIMNKTTLAFHISQKNKKILENILNALEIGHIRYDKSWEGWIYSITNKEGIRKILKYLTKHKLHTKKNSHVVTFKRLLYFIDNKYHLENIESKKYKKIFNIINLFRKKI